MKNQILKNRQRRSAITGLFCLLFAYTDAASLRLHNLGIPAQLVETLPYVVTILVLVIAGVRITLAKRRIRAAK